jgi:hypothetical protein
MIQESPERPRCEQVSPRFKGEQKNARLEASVTSGTFFL